MSFTVGHASTLDMSTSEKDYYSSSLDEVVKGVPSRDHLLVLMDANARTGIRGIGWTDSKVLGAYGRDELNDNGEQLLIHGTDNKLALLNTYYATPARGISYTFQRPNRGKAQYRLDYILIRQVDRRLVCNVTVRTPPRGNAESDHNLVIRNIRLLGRIAPNRPKGVVKNRRAIDLPRLMADPQLRMNFKNAIAAKLASPIPGTNARSVDDMTSLLTETLLSNAADTAPPIRCQQVWRGWCAAGETKAELNARWQVREGARKRVRSASNNRGLRRALKATTKQLKRTRAEAVQRFFDVSQLEGRIREGDQFGFCKHLKGMDVEEKRTFNTQYIEDEEGRLLRDNALMRERLVRWFHKLLNTKSPTLDPSIVDELKQCPPYRPLDAVPSRYEVEEAICALANRKPVGPDGFPAELLKVLANEGELNTLGKFHDIIVAVWRGDGVLQQWKDATIKVLHKKKDRTECGNYRGICLVVHAGKVLLKVIAGHLPRSSRRQSTPRSHRGAPE